MKSQCLGSLSYKQSYLCELLTWPGFQVQGSRWTFPFDKISLTGISRCSEQLAPQLAAPNSPRAAQMSPSAMRNRCRAKYRGCNSVCDVQWWCVLLIRGHVHSFTVKYQLIAPGERPISEYSCQKDAGFAQVPWHHNHTYCGVIVSSVSPVFSCLLV